MTTLLSSNSMPMLYSRVCRALAAVLISSGTSTISLAQPPRLTVSAGTMQLDHWLTGRALNGGSIATTFGTGKSRLLGRLALERYTGESQRVGTTCTGLIPPGQCQVPEPLRDISRLFLISAGVAVRAIERPHFYLGGVLDGSVGSIDVDTRGTVTRTSIDGDASLWGFSTGLESRWRPGMRIPIAISGSAKIGFLRTTQVPAVVDGYEPFYGTTFSQPQFSIGISWLHE